jgi:hypothetical protein
MVLRWSGGMIIFKAEMKKMANENQVFNSLIVLI